MLEAPLPGSEAERLAELRGYDILDTPPEQPFDDLTWLASQWCGTPIALVSLVNQILGFLPEVADAPLSLERLLGWLMAPVAWLMGIPWGESAAAGSLLGTKTVLNELLAYLQLAALPEDTLSQRSQLILTYALCGFANLGSLGIMLGGMTVMAPMRRSEVVALGPKSILSGTIATCLTGTVVGLLTW